jgi:HEAT repeat protein
VWLRRRPLPAVGSRAPGTDVGATGTRAARKPAFWQRIFTVRLSGLLVIVAGSELVVEAWKYYRDNLDIERATTTHHLRELAGGPARVEAAQTLAEVRGQEMRRVFPAMIEAMGDRDAGVRAAATWAVGRLIRTNATSLRGEVVDEIATAVPLLLAATEDRDSKVRTGALASLAAVKIPKMLDPSTNTATVLHGPLGPDRRVVLSVLERALRDPDPRVRGVACTTYLEYIDAKDELPAGVLDALKNDPSWDVRAEAAYTLASQWHRNSVLLLSVDTASVVPPLVDLLRQERDYQQLRAIGCLTQLGPVIRPAILDLRDSPHPLVRKWVNSQLDLFDTMDRDAAAAEAEYRRGLKPTREPGGGRPPEE